MRLLKLHWRSLAVACIPLFFIVPQAPLVFSWTWEHRHAFQSIPSLVVRSDNDGMGLAAPWLVKTLKTLQNAPMGQNFYFSPNFDDGPNNAPPWWTVCAGLRYAAYPQLIFSHEPGIYNNSRGAYRAMFIGDKRRYDELYWIHNNNIRYIVYIHNLVLSSKTSDSTIDL